MNKTRANYWIFFKKYSQGLYSERLGQAFCNEFDVTDDMLFYSEEKASFVFPRIGEIIDTWPKE